MIRIAVVITHDKGAAANQQQVTILNNNLTATPDANGAVTYTITGFGIDHEVQVLQVIPQGVTPPANMDVISSRKVFYGNDQPSTAMRFFNWGAKRAIDCGAQVVILVRDITQMTITDLRNAALELRGTKLLVVRPWGYLIGPKALRVIGQLNETLTFAQAVAEYQDRIAARGYSVG